MTAADDSEPGTTTRSPTMAAPIAREGPTARLIGGPCATTAFVGRVVPARSAQNLSRAGLLLGVDLEDLVEPGDPEDLEEVGVDAAELELALDRPDLLLEVDQLAQRGAGEVLHVAEVQQDLLVPLVLHQAVELVADLLDVLLGDDLGIDEADDRDPINGFQAEMTARGLRHRADSCPGSEPHPTGQGHVV